MVDVAPVHGLHFGAEEAALHPLCLTLVVAS